MKLIAKLHKLDNNQVEIWSSNHDKESLAGTIHIDNFTGLINERICEGHPVQLHVEIAQPKAYKILEALTDGWFDMLSSEARDKAYEDIKSAFSDLAYNNWSYDNMEKERTK